MIKIFVEGNPDRHFIDTLIKLKLNKSLKYEIIPTGGFTKLEYLKPQLLEAKDFNEETIIIFDADHTINGGGYQNRLDYLNKFKTKGNFDYSIFLFPNDSSDGTFEHLLEKIINPEHQRLIDCFTQYEDCIKQYKDDNNVFMYQLPIQKSKIYAYMESFKKTNKENEIFKRGNYFFDDSRYWDLESQYLNPLIEFLNKFFN